MRPYEIEDKLYSEIMKALYKKYGDTPDSLIMNRVQEEWKAIKREGLVLETAFIDEFTSWLRAEKSPYYMEGNCGSSLILYLLHITPVNPLPPHLYCPECGSVEWKEEHKDGFDIPSGRCKNDGCECKGDGHNLVWQMMWEKENDYSYRYYLNTYRGLDYHTEIFLNNHWMKHLKIRGIGLFGEKDIWKNICFSFSLDNWYDADYYQVALDDSCFKKACSIWRKYQLKEAEEYDEMIMGVPQPRDFSELFSNIGLSACSGTWDDEIAHRVYVRNSSTSELLIYSEDLFFHLIKNGYSEYKAWKTVFKCNKNPRHFDTVLEDPKIRLDDNLWTIVNCNRFYWLKPKAKEITFLFHEIRLGGIERKSDSSNIFSNYRYMYQGLRTEEIEERLYSEIMEALYKKYGPEPDALILERLEDEWNGVKKTDTVLDIAFLHEFTCWMRKEKFPWLVSAGACFVLYLLKVTEANPLPAHAYCPACHKVIWYLGMPSGYDIDFLHEETAGPYDIVPLLLEPCECGNDERNYICDGHNLIWQTVFGGAEYEYVQFELHVPIEMENELPAFISEHWLNELADAAIYNPHKNILSGNCLHLGFRYNLYKEEYPSAFVDWEGKKCFGYDTLKISLALIANSVEMNRFYDINLPKPRTFGELVYNFGLFHGKGTWNDMTKYMVRKQDYYTPSLVVFKEDVFSYLRKHGYTQEEAWFSLQQVQFGLKLFNAKENLWWEHDRWVLDLIVDEKEPGTFHLWSKGHAVETLLHRIRKHYCCNVKN